MKRTESTWQPTSATNSRRQPQLRRARATPAALKAAGLDLPDTSKETLSAVSHPIAGGSCSIGSLAGLCTVMQGWLECLDSNNRLYPPLNPLGAATAASRARNPSSWPPRAIRRCGGVSFQTTEAVLIEADYASIEMRIAAWIAREERMLAVFRNGGDIHGETAALVLGDRQARQPAKPINFGCLYGGGAERLRITARTDTASNSAPSRPGNTYDRFFTTYSGLGRWHQSARILRRGVDLRCYPVWPQALGGSRRPQGRGEWNRFQLATNFPVQGTGADALKLAMVRLHREMAGTAAPSYCQCMMQSWSRHRSSPRRR